MPGYRGHLLVGPSAVVEIFENAFNFEPLTIKMMQEMQHMVAGWQEELSAVPKLCTWFVQCNN